MIQKRYISGKMNLDDSGFVLPKGDYREAYDIVTTEKYGGVKLMKGNRKVNYSLPAGTCVVTGALPDMKRDRIIYFVSNSNNKHCVMEYNNTTRTIQKIFENLTDSGGVDVLDLNGKIYNVNIIHKEEVDHIISDFIKANFLSLGLGDLLTAIAEIGKTNKDTIYFLDAQGRPTFMNLDRMRYGIYKPVTRDILDLAKEYPAYPIIADYVNDSTHRVNNMRTRLFRFRYGWIYDDNEATVWSPISKMPIPEGSLSEEYTGVPTNNNRIDLTVPTGGKQVKKLKIAMSYSIDNTWSDFALIDTITKSDYAINDNSTYTYQFYNDTVPTFIDPNDSIQLYDYAPRKAVAQELVNGNTLLFGNITEGYDPTIPVCALSTDYIEAGSVGGTGSLQAQVLEHIGGGDYIYTVIFTGSVVAGVVVKLMLEGNSSTTPFEYVSYTTVSSDTPNTVAANILALMTTGETYFRSVSNNVLTFHTSQMPTGWHLDEVKIINVPSTVSAASSASCWLNNTKRKLALAYFDSKGVTRAAETVKGMEVTIPDYKEFNGVPMLPVIKASISHQPPIWATSYSWLISADLSISSMLDIITVDVLTDADYIYFDVTTIPLTQEKNNGVKDVFNYQFAKGDRLRLLGKTSDGTVFDDTYDTEVVGLVVDPKINSTDETGKTFVKIKKENPFTPIDFSTNIFKIRLYTPAQVATAENQVFVEFGQTYKVLNPGTDLRAHEGQAASQVANTSPAKFVFADGDCYMRNRKVYIADTSTTSYYAFDMNFTDSYKSRVSSVSGRPFIIDDAQEERQYINLVRFSHAYQPNTNINGVNKFLAQNFDEYEVTYGDIKRLKARDGSVRVYQRLKVGNVPIYAQIIQDASGNDVLSLSDKLLNRIKYYTGEIGIGDTPESLASDNFADYFVSSDRGVICRLSNDGITPLSITERANGFATSELIKRGGAVKVNGVFDVESNRYMIFMDAVGSSAAKTLVFNERKNGFECFSYLKPELCTCLGTLLVSFKDGQLYTHDGSRYVNYFGKQYVASLTIPFNEFPDQKKTYIALSSIGSQLWECPKIETDLGHESELSQPDFKYINGTYHASFLRDKNSEKGLLQGDRLTGHTIFVSLCPLDSSVDTELTEVDVTFNMSHLNNR